jgi:hypothetical protein
MTRRAAIGLALVALAVAPAAAHHSWPVDTSRAVTVTGTVTGYEWGNPHVMIGLDVKSETGAIEKWNVGGPSTTRMEARGWTRSTLKPGDVITATGYRFSDGQRILRLDKVVIAGGKELLLYGR